MSTERGPTDEEVQRILKVGMGALQGLGPMPPAGYYSLAALVLKEVAELLDGTGEWTFEVVVRGVAESVLERRGIDAPQKDLQ